MLTCDQCGTKQREIERQGRLIEQQQQELKLARSRIKDLEHALLESCEYAEVCKHFPGLDLVAPEHG